MQASESLRQAKQLHEASTAELTRTKSRLEVTQHELQLEKSQQVGAHTHTHTQYSENGWVRSVARFLIARFNACVCVFCVVAGCSRERGSRAPKIREAAKCSSSGHIRALACLALSTGADQP